MIDFQVKRAFAQWTSVLSGRTSAVRSLLLCGLLAIAPLLSTCANPATGPRTGTFTRIDSTWVTSNVFSSVDATTGQFLLSRAAGQFVSAAVAETLAIAEARLLADPTLAGNLAAVLQQQRGAVIDYAHLAPCSRFTYSLSPVGDIPPAVPGWLRRSIGSHWAVPMCGADGTAALSIGIPDQPRDVRVVAGHLVFRSFGGGSDIDVVGVPVRYPAGLPLAPEDAVAIVFKRTGIRIRAVPIAYDQYVNGVGSFALCASWHVMLEQPVSLIEEGTGLPTRGDELFVRRTPSCFADSVAFFVAPGRQPLNEWVRFPRDTSGRGSLSDVDSALVPLNGPTVFERVRLP